MVGCVQAVLGKNKFLVQYEYGQKKEMSSSYLLYLCEKEEVGQEAYETTSDLPQKEQGEWLTIH